MVDLSRIDSSAMGQYPLYLPLVEGDLTVVIERFSCLGIFVRKAFNQLVLFQRPSHDFSGILGSDFLILDTQRVNANDRRLSTKTMTSRGTDFHLFVKPLFFDLFLKSKPNLVRAVGTAPRHTDIYPSFGLFLSSEDLVAVPFQLADR
jgi:hypothetical protein